MDANMLLAWHKYGGGKQLLSKLYASIGANVVSFPFGPMATQPLGWYKKQITKPDDFKGLKFRTVGISIDVFQGLGAAVNALPGGEIVPALDRGLIDAAELPPERRAARDHLQQDEVRRAARQDEGHHRERGRGRLGRHVVEVDRPLLEGLHRAADQGQGPVLHHAAVRPAEAAGDL